MKTRGRPKSKNPRNKTILLKLTEEEFELIGLKANSYGMNRSKFIRKRILR